MSISTHVLDLVKGGPASGVPVRLERHDGEAFVTLVEGATDDDGRIGGLVPKGSGKAGVHRIRFDTGAWFESQGTRGFYPYVEVVFEVVEPEAHHHVPLLLGPYGYSTYRGELTVSAPGPIQPSHVLYGGAHLFTARTAVRLGERALSDLHRYGQDPETFAAVLGVPTDLATEVWERTHDKLRTEPIEDLRIDFEDGFGHRPETEEKEHAVRAARELATALRQGIAPRLVGIRPRPISHDGRFQRTLGTFLRELATVGRVPAGFAVTVPKPLSADDVETAAYAVMRLEDELSLEAGTLHLELMLETPEALMDDEGRCPLPRWVAAGMGRVRAVHLGPYDLTASLGVIGSDQDVDHPACDLARATAAIALARKGIWLADGPTTRLPIGPHRGDELTEPQEAENRAVVHEAWARHARNVRSALRQGYVQGWDLHPAQLPARFGALAAVFVAELPAMAARLRRYVEAAAQATRTGADFDDAATARGLVRWFRRGLDSGLLTPEDLARAGLGGTDLVPSGG